jgi:hypothetical protein
VAVGGIHVLGEFDATIRVGVVAGNRNEKSGVVGLARAVLVVAGLDLVDSCLSGGRWRILHAAGSGSGSGVVESLQAQELVNETAVGGVLDTHRIDLVLLCGSCPEGVVGSGGARSFLHTSRSRSVDLTQCLHTIVNASQARTAAQNLQRSPQCCSGSHPQGPSCASRRSWASFRSLRFQAMTYRKRERTDVARDESFDGFVYGQSRKDTLPCVHHRKFNTACKRYDVLVLAAFM